MPDPRVNKLAQLLIKYSLDLQPDEKFHLRTSPLADELNLLVYKEAILAGANVTVNNMIPGTMEVFYRHANDSQLAHISPLTQLLVETWDADLYIEADHNTRELSAVDPTRIAISRKAQAGLAKRFHERAAKGEIKWSLTVYPTQSLAQEADMSLADYQDFVYGAGHLDEDDPIAFWKNIGLEQEKYIHWLRGKDHVTIKGENVDLQFSVKGRSFESCSGKLNFPDGEIFTGPVEESVNGYIRFSYPAIFSGQEVDDIELWFENGLVVKEKAGKGQDLLTKMLNTDDGSRYLGEWGIGTNYGIKRFTKNMLFDEKMGGTIHLAVGGGYPETGSKNVSGIHWDMLCDMHDSEVRVDGELFYKDGEFAFK